MTVSHDRHHAVPIQSGSKPAARITSFLVGRKSLPNRLYCRSYRRISRANLAPVATFRDASRVPGAATASIRRQHEHGDDAQRTGMPEMGARREYGSVRRC